MSQGRPVRARPDPQQGPHRAGRGKYLKTKNDNRKNICNLLHLADQLRQLASEDQGGVPDVLARRHDAAVEPGGLGQEEQGRDQVQEQEVWTPRHPDLLLLQQGRPPR